MTRDLTFSLKVYCKRIVKESNAVSYPENHGTIGISGNPDDVGVLVRALEKRISPPMMVISDRMVRLTLTRTERVCDLAFREIDVTALITCLKKYDGEVEVYQEGP